MRALAEALRFLSIIPVPGRPPKKASRVPAAYPWAGLILGIIAAAAAWAGGWIFGAAGTAVIIVAVRIGITGGLHMDGLADLADGMGGGKDREKCLTIMADSRLGSFGALALLVMCALQIAVIAELISLQGYAATPKSSTGPVGHLSLSLEDLYPLISAPALSRGIIPLMMRLFPSARPGGMGDRNRASASPAAVISAIISVLLITAFFYGVAGLILTAVVTGIILCIAAGISRRLGGHTGDVYGALIETGDLLALFGILLLYRLDLSSPGLLSLIP